MTDGLVQSAWACAYDGARYVIHAAASHHPPNKWGMSSLRVRCENTGKMMLVDEDWGGPMFDTAESALAAGHEFAVRYIKTITGP